MFVDEVFAVYNVELSEVFHAIEEFFFPGGDVFIERVVVEKFLMFEPEFDVCGCKVLIEKVAHAQSVSSGLVHVCWSNAFECGTDFLISLREFRGLLERAVSGKNEVCSIGDEDVFLKVHAEGSNGIAFALESNGIEHDAISDEVDLARVENAGGDLMQHHLLVFYIEGMACVWSALEACNHIIVFSEIIYNLSFSLVAPLEA